MHSTNFVIHLNGCNIDVRMRQFRSISKIIKVTLLEKISLVDLMVRTSPITDDGKSYAEKGMIGYSRFRRNCQSPLCCSGPNVRHELDLQTQ